MTWCATVSMVVGVAAFVSAPVAFGQAAQDATDAARSAGERELAEDRAKETRALVDDVLHKADLQSTQLMAAVSLSSIDWHFNLGAFQEEEDVEPASGNPIDYDHDGDVDKADLARAAQNPVADLISLPFQNNLNFDVGALDHEQNVLNIQPVIPLNLNDEWNLITRTIVPVIYQPSLFPGDGHDFGLGDIQFTGFLSPKKPVGGWILGGGPVIQFPTATDERLGARKWTAGPSAVALRMEGPWVFGALIQNVWSFAGSGDNSVNSMLIQPFVNYNMADGWYLVSAPIITANWEADSSDRWVVPVGGGLGKIFRLGGQPINFSVQGYYNVETPAFGPEWQLRIQLQLLFPR